MSDTPVTPKLADAIEAAFTLENHLDVMARWVLLRAYEAWAEDSPWESIPEVGDYDFHRIVDYVEELLPGDVTLAEFEESYKFFEGRADE